MTANLESPFPTAIDKRDLIHDAAKQRNVDLPGMGDAFFDAGRLSEALDFYHLGSDLERVRRVKDASLAAGDYFMLARVASRDQALVSEAEWEQLGDLAVGAGRLHDAVAAFARIEAQAKLEDARAKLEEFQPGGGPLHAPGSVQADLEPVSDSDAEGAE